MLKLFLKIQEAMSIIVVIVVLAAALLKNKGLPLLGCLMRRELEPNLQKASKLTKSCSMSLVAEKSLLVSRALGPRETLLVASMDLVGSCEKSSSGPRKSLFLAAHCGVLSF